MGKVINYFVDKVGVLGHSLVRFHEDYSGISVDRDNGVSYHLPMSRFSQSIEEAFEYGSRIKKILKSFRCDYKDISGNLLEDAVESDESSDVVSALSTERKVPSIDL